MKALISNLSLLFLFSPAGSITWKRAWKFCSLILVTSLFLGLNWGKISNLSGASPLTAGHLTELETCPLYLHKDQRHQAEIFAIQWSDIPQKTMTDDGLTMIIVELYVPDIERLARESVGPRKLAIEQRKVEATRKSIEEADAALIQAINKVTSNLLKRLSKKEHQVIRHYLFSPFLALEVTPEGLRQLMTAPEVKSIHPDLPVPLPMYKSSEKESFATPDESSLDDLSKPVMADTVGLIGAEMAWENELTGKGWYVAVLDNGIRRSHEFLQGKHITEACFSLLGHCPNGKSEMYGTGAAAHYPSRYSGYDHGTHVAGIAVGNRLDGSLSGVAKDADIIAVNIFSKFYGDDCGDSLDFCLMSYISDYVKALDYVFGLSSTHDIGAVNLSISGELYYNYCDGHLAKYYIDMLRSTNISTVIATGNDFYCGAVGAPSCISTAIAVMASTKDDIETIFTNWHPTVADLFAPGESIYSATGRSDTDYQFWDGTSMAAPHVAGGMTIMRQSKPTDSVGKQFNRITRMGPYIATICPDSISKPRINVDNFVASANSLPGVMLLLIEPSPEQDTLTLCESLDNCDLLWTSGGHSNWYGQRFDYHYGGSSAQSGAVTHNQQTWLETFVNGPGTITFHWKVSSEFYFDYLSFYLNGSLQQRISGEVGWHVVSFKVPSGFNTMRWVYSKDGSVDRGADAGWVDRVVWN